MLLTSVRHISDLQRRIIERKELQKGKILKKENIKGGKELQRGNRAYRDVLKWDYSSRFLVGRELEVVETVVVEDEPSSLPTLVPKTIILNEVHPRSQLEQNIPKLRAPPATLFPEPALLVRVEEGVHQVVPVVLRDLEGLRLDRVEQGDQQLPRQILSIVDPPVHGDELLDAGLVLNARVVQAGVEHDDRKAQHVAGVGVSEDIRVELAISLSKSFHHSVDFLCFSRKPETPQELS